MGWFVERILGLRKLDPGIFLPQDHPGKTGEEQSLTEARGSLRSLMGCCLLAFSLRSLSGRGTEKLQATEAAGK